MGKPDYRINKYGINVIDLKPGMWVEIEWIDAPPSKCLIVNIDEYRRDYKGERSLDLLIPERVGRKTVGWYLHRATNSAVTKIIGTLK
jgi:hypothetical protein